MISEPERMAEYEELVNSAAYDSGDSDADTDEEVNIIHPSRDREFTSQQDFII